VRGVRTAFQLELTELAPLTVVGVVVAAILGADTFGPASAITDGALTMTLSGAALGAWQGWMDRRFAAHAFRRHRPIPAIRFQFARWLAGCVGVGAIFGGYVVAHAAKNAMPDAYWEYWAEQDVTPYVLTPLAATWVFLLGLLAWCIVRFTVASPGIVSAFVWTLVLPLAALTFVASSPGNGIVVLLSLAILVSVYQGYRLGRPRLGGAL